MTTMDKTTQEAFLKGLGLTAPDPDSPTTAKLVPDGLDPNTIEPGDIVFDPALLDGFPILEGQARNLATQHIFGLYRSNGRNKTRNGLLQRRITEFIGQVKRARATEGPVKGKIKAERSQREMAAMLAERGYDEARLAALIAADQKND